MKKYIESQITCSCGCGKKFTPIRDFRTKIIKSKLHPDCLRIKNNKKLLAQSTMYTKKESTSFKTGKYATKGGKGGKRAKKNPKSLAMDKADKWFSLYIRLKYHFKIVGGDVYWTLFFARK